ncbi:MAG: sulfatase-like hydrolase/transferase [Anaerohalosphaera sp.]|nr:sulfatase-like hydrolase/transferase [Anaerohalosphaera sp.]
MNRREFLKFAGVCSTVGIVGCNGSIAQTVFGEKESRPNIILCMADDLGYGDTGYNGHPIIKTVNLDDMASKGIRFDRFYSGSAVCSPTRGSAITGRHPDRYGITNANAGHMRKEEVTLAEALKTQGYMTGHFGKWHLGTLTRELKEANRGGPKGVAHYSPPWENGFDYCFATESKVPTYDPMVKPPKAGKYYWNSLEDGQDRAEYGTHYWVAQETMETKNLEGDDSRIIMDRAIPFIEDAVEKGKPFFAVIWFHSPHLPVVADKAHRDLYPGQDGYTQNYLGCITAMDEQIGRLREKLRKLGAADDTMLWFCSDNGPEGKKGSAPGSAGVLRGRKRSLYEGGIRVPGLLEWPGRVKKQKVVEMPCSTSDYFPTVMDVLGFTLEGAPLPRDGESLLKAVDGRKSKRSKPIGVHLRNQIALIDNRYKLYSGNLGKSFELYDIVEDMSETTDMAETKPNVVSEMKDTLAKWRNSCSDSVQGKDYQ